MRVLLTGSHGLIGSALTGSLESDGHDVTRLVRGEPRGPGEIRWAPGSATVDARALEALEGYDAAVNLAGAGIGDHRWTDDYRALIRDSRVNGTTLLARTLASLERPPKVFLSGSAVGYYGDRGDDELTEESGPGTGFLADVVKDWEESTAAAVDTGIRVVLLRSGVVLTPTGGALKRQLLPFRLGLGGRIGSGRQWFSWITLDDEVGAIRHAMVTDDVVGAVNLTAPEPVTNVEFTRTLGAALRRPTLVPTPTPALHLLLGRQLVGEMLLGGQRVLPARLTHTGYQFAQPRLGPALTSMLGGRRR